MPGTIVTLWPRRPLPAYIHCSPGPTHTHIHIYTRWRPLPATMLPTERHPCLSLLLYAPFTDANVIADLVYRRFRPNVDKRKLIVLLFPPPYQQLGEPVSVVLCFMFYVLCQ